MSGLRERVETHLFQDYDCTVISRSRSSAAQFEHSIKQMQAADAPAVSRRTVPAADFCAWVSAWDINQYQQVPAAGLREFAWSVTDLTQPSSRTNQTCRERVPERSDYERTLARRIAEHLHLAARPKDTPSASKVITLAVLPFVHSSDANRVYFNKTLPADKTYLHAEAALADCLPDGAAILSRDRIRQILAEHNLSALANNGAGLRAVAYLLPADALVCGAISRRLSRPTELRLDLHLVNAQSSVLQAAWQGCCADQADLPKLAAQGMKALMAMPWQTGTINAGAGADIRRRHEAENLIAHACFAEAWDLARDVPALYAPILQGVLSQAENFCYADTNDAGHDTYERQRLREILLTLDDMIGKRPYLESERDRVPWPDLIHAETTFWLGEFSESERLCRAHLSEHPHELTARARLILAWALFGQKQLTESQALFKAVAAEKGLMWYFPRLGAKTHWYWLNSLSIQLATASGNSIALYQQVRQKMKDRKLIYPLEIQAYLREVDRQQTPEQAIRELSSVLIYGSGDSLYPEWVARRPMNLAYRGWFIHLCPAYVVRGRCYEKVGKPQQATEDYALYLRMRSSPHVPNNLSASNGKKAKNAYDAEAIDGLDRLQKAGIRPKQKWLTPAETRPFPSDAHLYVIPVGLYDKGTIHAFVQETSRLMGTRVLLLPDVPLPGLPSREDKKGLRYYDAKALCASVLVKREIPSDVIQLVLATSENFRFAAEECEQQVGSPDNGATLLLSVKNAQNTPPYLLGLTVARCLHYRYAAPVSKRAEDEDSALTTTFLRTWDCCSSPCLFCEEMADRFHSGDTLPLLCPDCQAQYQKADFAKLKKQTSQALKKEGVILVPPGTAP